MIELVLSIVSSSIIFMIFKLFDRFGIDTFQAIVFNYFTAFACGMLLYGNQWDPKALDNPEWIYYVLVCSILFISLFWLMGKSSQQNGVAITSVAVKMSMAFSMLLMIILYSESINLFKGMGIGLAFLGIYLVSSQNTKESQSRSNALLLLIILFAGSGFLDFSINFIQKYVLNVLTPSLFSSFALGCAGILGITVFIIQLKRGKARFHIKNVVAGMILGIPNYFSIYLLMRSYQTTGWADSTVLAVTNVSIVLVSALIGIAVFSEKMSTKRVLGLVCAILAIITLALNS